MQEEKCLSNSGSSGIRLWDSRRIFIQIGLRNGAGSAFQMNSVSLGVMLLVKVLLCTNAGREVVDPATFFMAKVVGKLRRMSREETLLGSLGGFGGPCVA